MRIHSMRMSGAKRGGSSYRAGRKTEFPTCAACHDAGWRPSEFVQVN